MKPHKQAHQQSRHHRKRAVTTAPAAAALAAALGAGLLAGASGSAQAAPVESPVPASSSASASASARTVTLVTGDKVALDAKGKVTGVVAAEGRKGIAFRIQQAASHAYVVPRDAEPLIANGTVDRRLFDVKRLVGGRYDDARRSDVPLIVTYDKGTSVSEGTFRSSGATVRRDLPSINGDAVRARKSEGSALWETLTSGSGSSKVRKIWLDGKVKASLDRSVPQIGAPAAHSAGYDGKGVKVAVLDTGIDATHPDLKDRIDAEKNFSAAADTVDRAGHGTHVASTIAGSGAASPAGTKYAGVAPGARLLVGKVLDDEGSGEDSGVIAGMQWAVAQGAKVVNMSLGGTDAPGIDPVEQAVADLSASSGALFVIAAGNEGPDEGTIGTPGSSAAALTVGAVDRQDAIAEFSSRGPTADGSLKPDITAPGVGIVAAKAAEGFMGDPAADGYVSLSGTSMATPHVAGAAAILAQQHPDWTGERIKAALTASAKPLAATSAYTQGTGRVDVAAAIAQQLTSSPTSLGFGTQQYPHTDDKPVAKTVTYRNAGTGPLTLDLTTEAYGNDGKPAAEGLFTVSPKQLTVPAGGEATATVTADTRVGTAEGAFGGSVTAAGGGSTVRTAIGVDREIESYNLTIKHLDLKGKADGEGVTTLFGLDNDLWQDILDKSDGEATVRLPKGLYSLEGTLPTGDIGWSLLLRPRFALTKDTTLVMDARTAKPVRVTVPDGKAKPRGAVFYYHLNVNNEPYSGIYTATALGNFRVAQFGAPVSAREASATYHGTWTDKAVNYRLAWNRTGDLSGFTQNVKRSQLAKVKVVVGAPAKGKRTHLVVVPLTPGGYYNPFPTEAALPTTGTDYVLPDGVKWFYQANQHSASGADDETPVENNQASPPKTFAAGKEYTLRFNTGVFGPHLPSGPLSTGIDRPGAVRSGDSFSAYLPLFSDGGGNLGSSLFTKAASSLYADGKKIFALNDELDADSSYTLPAGKRNYRLAVDVSRDPSQSAVSTRVAAAWTFTSAHAAGDTPERLPLTVVRFAPKLTTASTAKARTTLTVPFTLEGAATEVASLRKLAFAVSYDGGKTWKKASSVDGKHLKLRSPAKPGTVSLRATLTDADGNTLNQTIYSAYRTTK